MDITTILIAVAVVAGVGVIIGILLGIRCKAKKLFCTEDSY